ncbi:energy-coupling factor transporter transmembrane component T [Petroclostridium sp. X23]|uniref:energy-coupling factor transporter transmembrane component T family protein n=1 Tax=Petroclostridium sp. X23 TaxID=3045146 RepID=UPI0024ACD90C|nr:energy-coupling factor transporter transmembrane component T [Petroclostridium sp. X23]WHH60327.1 energy-coupling factor transporter transmembrane component T [Petroclostridium sp. X23]
MPALVEYIPANTVMHKLNPITKILWTIAVLTICFMFNQPAAILLVLISNLAVAALSKVLKQVLPAIIGLFIFSLLLILFQIFFVTEGNTLFYIIPFVNIGRITDVGLEYSAVLALRMLATTSTIPILMTTTQMKDIVVVLTEKCKVPFKYAFMFVTSLRFIPTFMEEMDQILQAQKSRGYDSDTRNPFKKLFIIIPLAIPLLISSVKKAEKMAISMEVRGFGAGPRSHYNQVDMKTKDYAVIICLIAITFISILI